MHNKHASTPTWSSIEGLPWLHRLARIEATTRPRCGVTSRTIDTWWLGDARPEPAWIVRSRCDLRVGGEWIVEFGPSEDQLYRHSHVFEVIERPYRIQMTTTETRLDGSSFATEMEFVFEDEGGGRTRMRLHHSGFPTAGLRDEHCVGLPKAFDQFGLFVDAQSRR